MDERPSAVEPAWLARWRSRPDIWALVLIVGAWAAVMYRQLFLGETLFVGDSAWVFFPLRCLGAARMRQGALGLWNPHVFGGVPFAADPQSQVFYPFHLLLWLLPVPAAMATSTAAHCLIQALGAYLFGRYSLRLSPAPATVLALAFGLCAPTLERAGIAPYPEALAWLPWALVALDWSLRPPRFARLWAPAAVLATQLLAGAPQYTYYTLMAMGAVGAVRLLQRPGRGARWRVAGAVALAVLLGSLLSSIQMLPAAELAPLTDRAHHMGMEFAEQVPLHVRKFFETLLLPQLYGTSFSPERQGFVIQSELGYVGVLPLALALVALLLSRRRKLVAWMAGGLLFSLLLAAPTSDPAFPLIYHLVPGLGAFRCASAIIVLTDLALAALAALGLEALLAGSEAARPGRRLLWAATLAALIPGLAALVGAAGARSAASAQLLLCHPAWPWPQVAVAVASSLAVAALCRLRPGHRLGPIVAVGALLLLGLDLVLFSCDTDIAAAVPNFVLQGEPESVQFQRRDGSGDRQWNLSGGPPLRQYLATDRPVPENEQAFRATVAFITLELMPADVAAAWQMDGLNGAWGATLPLARHVPTLYRDRLGPVERQWLDLLNVRYYADMAEGKAPSDAALAFDTGRSVQLYRVSTCYPRAFWAARAEPVASCAEAIARIEAAVPFDAYRTVYVEGLLAGEATPPLGGEPGRVVKRTWTPERMVLDVSAPTDGWAVVSDNYFPSWKATVDGSPVKVHPANAVMRAVRVPAGNHQVVMVCYSTAVCAGGFLTLCSLALMAATLSMGVVWRIRVPSRGFLLGEGDLGRLALVVVSGAIGLGQIGLLASGAVFPEMLRKVTGPSGWLAMSAFGLVVIAAALHLLWHGDDNRRERIGALAAVVVGLCCLSAGLTVSNPHGFAYLSGLVLNPASNSYYQTARGAGSLWALLGDYHLKMASFISHAQTQGAGPVIFFGALGRLYDGPLHGATEWVARVLLDLKPGLAAGDLASEFSRWWGYPITADDVASTLLVGLTVLFLSGLTVFPLYALVREAGGRRAAVVATAAYCLIPAMLLYSCAIDQVYPLLTATAALFVVRSLAAHREAALRRTLGWAAAAGLVLAVALFLSLGAAGVVALLAIAALGSVLARAEKGRRLAEALALWRPALALAAPIVLLFGLLYLAAGYDLLAVARTSDAIRMYGYDHLWGRPYGRYLWLNWAEALLFAGPLLVPTLAGALRSVRRLKQQPEAACLILATCVVLVLIDVTGKIRGETSRMWLFLAPCAALACGMTTLDERLGRRTLAVVAALAAAFVLVLYHIVRVWGY